MKKLLSIIFAMFILFSLFACTNNNLANSNSSFESSNNSIIASTSTIIDSSSSKEQASVSTYVRPAYVEENPTIYLAGDSTVKTYPDYTFIGGWGQFLDLYIDPAKVNIVNKSEGGRSTRSFINEGRLWITEGGNKPSIESTIKAGDFLFIQFGHNDDSTYLSSTSFGNMVLRNVPLGEPDINGIFPSTAGVECSTSTLPEQYLEWETDETKRTSMKNSLKSSYGDLYYAYGSGTYKWYLKQFIAFARSKNATPVIVTPVSRVKFDSANKIIGGDGKFGDNFEYITACRQVAEEENCLLIDLHAETIKMLETATPTNANYLMALKNNYLPGVWPTDYDFYYDDPKISQGIEGTHYNKYGAFITAAKVADILHDSALKNETKKDGEKVTFDEAILFEPIYYMTPSTKMTTDSISSLKSLFTYTKISAN